MYLEIKIIKDNNVVKRKLKEISSFYEEDKVVENTVFIKTYDFEELEKLSDSICYRKNQLEYIQ